MQIVEADLTLVGDRLLAGCRVAIDEFGRIASVEEAGVSRVTKRLPRRALLPGMISVHSHAFQLGLRGRTERFPVGAGDFWSWRDEMYELANELDAGGLYDLSRRTYQEMRAAGITAVGEMHYLRHVDPDARDFAFDDALLAAAEDAGVRLVLIPAHYATGDIDRPLDERQRRFATGSAADYVRRFDELALRLRGPGQTLAVGVHSVRAASLEEISTLHALARERALPFQIHVEEQAREAESCLRAHGARPVDLLLARLDPGAELVAVHCTDTPPDRLAALLAAGCRVCLCPLTEANLGDPVPALPERSGKLTTLCLGTDANVRISMIEELRQLEYAQRSARVRRGVVLDDLGRSGLPLLRAATANGAAALNLAAGAIRAGAWADLMAIDLDAAPLRGIPPERLLDAIVVGASNEIVAATTVGGTWREHR